MTRPNFAFVTTGVVIGAIATALAVTRLLTVAPYGDEWHFFPSTLALTPFTFSRLSAFQELSSPTFFIAFSYVLQVAGSHIEWCRALIFVSLCVSIHVYRRLAAQISADAGGPAWAADVSLLLLMTFPYLLVCGVFYYTDVPAMLFGVLAYRAFEERRSWQAVAWSTLALHCRQFMIFVPAAMAFVELWRARQSPASWGRVAMWSIPLLTYAPYLIMWRDVSPMRAVYPQLTALPVANPMHVAYLLAASGFYLLPLAARLAWRRWTWTKVLAVLLAAAWIAIAPPERNAFFALIDRPITTLGLVDSALSWLGSPALRTGMLAAGAGMAAALQFELLARTPESTLTLRVLLVAFWVMNAFSHLTWDKYLLPVLPFIYLMALTHPAMSRPARSRA